MRVRWTLVGVLGLLLGGAGCPGYIDYMDNDPVPLDEPGQIVVEPVIVDFGVVEPQTQASVQVTLRNVGPGTLVIDSLTLAGPEGFDIASHGEPVLAPGAQTQATLAFEGLSPGVQQATLEVRSGDPDDPVVDVTLSARCDAPMVELDPPAWDFGNHEVGCEPEQDITIRNVGNAPLVLTSLQFETTSDEMQMSFYFPQGTGLGPNQEQVATVYYAPLDAIPDTALLHVQTNDPWTPDAVATLTGTAHFAAQVEDEFIQQPGQNQVDVLWVLDDTGWVGDEIASIQLNIDVLLDILSVLGLDLHSEIVTTTSGELFEYTRTMLTPPETDIGGPMEGFLRPDAGLRVVFFSASDDASPNTVIHYTNAMQALKPDPDHVVLSAVSGQDTGCTLGNHFAAPAPRLHQAVGVTGGVSASLCGDWTQELTPYWQPWKLEDTFELSQDPVPSTLEVLVDSVPLFVGWYYDVVYNAVVFEPDHVPAEGATITIRYHIWGTCEG